MRRSLGLRFFSLAGLTFSCAPSAGTPPGQLSVPGCTSGSDCETSSPESPVESDPVFAADAGRRRQGEACVHADIGFEALVPTVILLVDRSGSMNDAFDQGLSRWESLRRALVDPTSGVLPAIASRARLGLTFYTSVDGNRGGACPLLVEVPPAVDNGPELATKYLATEIGNQEDDTPTPESVRAVAEELAALPDPGPKAIVLATDGEPDTCDDPDAHDAATNALSVKAVRDALERGITTHVISVGNDVGQAHLEELARAGVGGASGKPYRALDRAGLEEAFAEVLRGVVTCDVELDGEVQPGQEERGVVELDGNPLALGDPDGWELTSPTTLRLVGDACRRAKLESDHLHVAFPCDAFAPIE